MPEHSHTSHHHHQSRKKLSPQTQRGVIVVLAVIAVFNVGWLGLRALVSYRMKHQYIETTGVVVDVTRQKSDNLAASEQHYPIVEFHTQEGKSVVFKAKVGSPEPRYQPGQTVVILYNKERPYVALLDTTQN